LLESRRKGGPVSTSLFLWGEFQNLEGLTLFNRAQERPTS
jgi:hypothetical protein